MAIFSNSIIPAAAAAADDVVTKSCRFEKSSTSNLNQDNPATDSARKMTLSFWVKLVETPSSETALITFGGSAAGGGSQSELEIRQKTDGKIYIKTNVNNAYVYAASTTRLFRDFSSFYHIVIAWDNDQATGADRLKFYVNNEQETLTGTFPSRYYDDRFGATGTNVKNRIGSGVDGSSTYVPSSSYMADIIRIDGQQLTPSSFAEEDATTGQWKPKDTSGLTFGSAGFRLDFEDSSDIGNDVSGNDNDFTTTNLAASDVVNDTPTNNFCTWNPISGPPRTQMAFSEGNLRTYGGYDGHDFPRIMGTMAASSGKWFYEVRSGGADYGTGVQEAGFKGINTTWPSYGDHGLGGGGSSGDWEAHAEISYSDYHLGIKSCASATALTTDAGQWDTAGDVIGLALDLDASPRTMKIYKNGTGYNSANLPTGGADAFHPAIDHTSDASGGVSTEMITNFGQNPTFNGNESGTTYTTDASDDDTGGEFTMQPPAGYKAWTTANLPTPTIAKPAEHFDTAIYTGNATDGRTNAATLEFQPDLVWIKRRSSAKDHGLYDSVRGTSNELESNSTTVEDTSPDQGYVSAFNATGFTLTEGGTDFSKVNGDSSNTYVAWNWKAGTSFDAGGGSGTGSKNVDAGFSIAKWTGDDDGMDMSGNPVPQAITHGLNPLTPEMIIVKNRTANASTSGNWAVYHKDVTSGKYLVLDGTGAETSWGTGTGEALFSSIGATTASVSNDAMTSSIYLNYADSTGGYADDDTYIGYFFASVEGYSKVGSYEGNNSADGPFVYCGFRPRWIVCKRIDGTSPWAIIDTTRDPYNDTDAMVAADTSLAETSYAATSDFDILSNGFKLRHNMTYGYVNQSDTHIFYAVAESPFKYASAR